MSTARHATTSRGPAVPRWFASSARIAAQLKGDPRTIALILVMPLLLMTLLYYVFVDAPVPPGREPIFDSLGPIMLGVLPMLLMFIVTSIVMLRERTSGTLERLFTTPLSRWNLLASYGFVFGVLGVGQAALLSALVLGPLGVGIDGPVWALLLVALLDAVVGVALGLLASAFARTEFQAVQFMPVVIAPQIFLCGLLVPKDQMPDVLARISEWLPMTWAVTAVKEIQVNPDLTWLTWQQLGLLAGLIVAVLLVASLSMPRRTR